MAKNLKLVKNSQYYQVVIYFLLLNFLIGCTTPRLPLEIVPERVGGVIHTVQKGETLWRISKVYNVNLDTIVKVNKITDHTKIKVGQKLLIPGVEKKREVLNLSLKDSYTFIWPTKGEIVSYFREIKNHLINKGIIIRARLGQEVLSSRAGRVAFCAENLDGYGKIIIIEHDEGFATIYANNLENLVKLNEKVEQGEVIAKVGMDQRLNMPALHFQIRKNNKPQNPLYYLP
jgi:murein DD-endopeptidase MepM/ murein hydrolase activator NlpD